MEQIKAAIAEIIAKANTNTKSGKYEAQAAAAYMRDVGVPKLREILEALNSKNP